jgi:hypothetical protein
MKKTDIYEGISRQKRKIDFKSRTEPEKRRLDKSAELKTRGVMLILLGNRLKKTIRYHRF